MLINPGETHTGAAAHAQGWAYCGMYPAASLLQSACQRDGRAGGDAVFRETVIVDPALSRELVGLHRLLREVADPLTRESALYAVFWPGLAPAYERARASAGPGAHGGGAGAVQILADRLAEPVSLQEIGRGGGAVAMAFKPQFSPAFGLPPVAWRTSCGWRAVWLAQGRRSARWPISWALLTNRI